VSYGIEVTIKNPGQVFACLGFLELAQLLGAGGEGGFERLDRQRTRFLIEGEGGANPFAVALEFIGNAEVEELGLTDSRSMNAFGPHAYPAPEEDTMTRPVLLSVDGVELVLSSWTEPKNGLRHNFKLFAGNRSAASVLKQLLHGDKKKGIAGVRQLVREDLERLVDAPFDLLVPTSGSFNLDPATGWDSLNDGYSLNQQKHRALASPILEVLALVGLQNARPSGAGPRWCVYKVWRGPLPLSLARAAVGGGEVGVETREFRFELGSKGKGNKTVREALPLS